MLTEKFTTMIAPLKLLKAGERGVVTRLHQSSDFVSGKLKALGIAPGNMITLEQRFPRYVIRLKGDRIPISDDVLQAIYIRVLH